MARITMTLSPGGHPIDVFCDQPGSVVKVKQVDIARAGGEVAYLSPEGARALDETAIPIGQQERVNREHELVLPTPPPKPEPPVELTVSLTGKSAEGFVRQCEAEGINAHERLRLIAATWRSHRKRKVK